jgi:hypothetical protein
MVALGIARPDTDWDALSKATMEKLAHIQSG